MRYRDWADAARAAVQKAIGPLPPVNKISRLSWVAYFAPSPSWSDTKQRAAIGELHRSKPDRDNIDKALLDALFKNDSGISAGTIEKRWDWVPRLEVMIEVDEP
jgi:Holliday junction resolvase RusA-like endonuclease